jgi:hypothetical protein
MTDAFAGGPVVVPDPGSSFEYITHPDGSVGRRFDDGREEKGFQRRCDNGTGGFTWVETTITISDVIDDVVDRARQTAPLPALDISPDPSAGGIVNLGMWLAVEPRSPSSVRVEAGSLWAVSTLSAESTTWSFGNGDSVTCAGIGVPLADPEVVEEGPCGYTYRSASPDGVPFQLTATVTWRVDYRSSAGPGSAGTIDRTVVVAYDVDEIQSIGTGASSSG